MGYVRADGLDNSGRFMTEEEGKRIADATVSVCQVGVTDPARLHAHHHIVWTRIRDDDVDRFDCHALATDDNAADLLCHFNS